jgi:hypothetical protein
MNFFRRFEAGMANFPLARIGRVGVDLAGAAQQQRRVGPSRQDRLTADDDHRIRSKMEAERANGSFKVG